VEKNNLNLLVVRRKGKMYNNFLHEIIEIFRWNKLKTNHSYTKSSEGGVNGIKCGAPLFGVDVELVA
jgi:hypothetical protein